MTSALKNAAIVAGSIALLIAGCSILPAGARNPAVGQAGAAAGFSNTVWKVSESAQVAAGTLYVFLEEGTLVIASAHGRPALGSWKYQNADLIMVEEGISYRIDILKLTHDEFRIRSNNPGTPVVITMVPADA
ncbi:MAG: hypothetical protein ABI580_02580 [Burkholderiaceae bacterium]